MGDPVILPVRPGALNAKDKAALRKAGVVVVEHDNPSELRLLRPMAELDSSQLLVCAMKALMASETYGSSGDHQREQFTKLVAAALSAASDKKP